MRCTLRYEKASKPLSLIVGLIQANQMHSAVFYWFICRTRMGRLLMRLVPASVEEVFATSRAILARIPTAAVPVPTRGLLSGLDPRKKHTFLGRHCYLKVESVRKRYPLTRVCSLNQSSHVPQRSTLQMNCVIKWTR